MKLISSLTFILFLSSVAWSQEKIDKRLLSRYSAIELNALESTSPDELKLLTYALDNGIYVANYSSEKGETFPVIDRPRKNQTYVDLNLEILDHNQYFKIKGEDKLLVVKSKVVLMNELKIK
tara:strand:- start:71 stop:436 length:366 start_codon:yes stop_codon:yes gene_type:complete